MTAADVLTDARDMLNDPSSFRWKDPQLIRALCDALDELWVNRRSAFNVGAIPVAKPANPTVAASPVLVQDQYRQPLAHYVTWLMLLPNGQDPANQRLSQAHWDAYEKGIS